MVLTGTCSIAMIPITNVSCLPLFIYRFSKIGFFYITQNSYSKVFPSVGFVMENLTVLTDLTKFITLAIILTKSKVVKMVSIVVLNLPTCVWIGQR